MKVINNVCPNCGARIPFTNANFIKCEFCDSILSMEKSVNEQTPNSQPQTIIVNANNGYSETMARYQHNNLMAQFDSAIMSWKRVKAKRTRRLVFWIVVTAILGLSMFGAEGQADSAMLVASMIAPCVFTLPFIIKNICQRASAQRQINFNVEGKKYYEV